MQTNGEVSTSGWSRFQRRMRTAPLWTHFVIFAVIYGGFQLMNRKPAEAAISALLYAAAMTVVVRVKRNRDKKAAGDRSLSDVASLEQSLRKNDPLPADFRDRVALQGLIARRRRQLRFGSIFAPIVFGCMTILGVVIGIASGAWWYAAVFALVTALSVWAPVHSRHRLDEKESRLNASLSGQPH
jgi:hypothetical protein